MLLCVLVVKVTGLILKAAPCLNVVSVSGTEYFTSLKTLLSSGLTVELTQ